MDAVPTDKGGERKVMVHLICKMAGSEDDMMKGVMYYSDELKKAKGKTGFAFQGKVSVQGWKVDRSKLPLKVRPLTLGKNYLVCLCASKEPKQRVMRQLIIPEECLQQMIIEVPVQE